MNGRPTCAAGARRRGVGSLVALALSLLAAVGPAIAPVSAATEIVAPASPAPVIDGKPAVALPDTFELHPDPPPPVGEPRIPWLAAHVPEDPGAHRTFVTRAFPLPQTVAWEQLFPTDRWIGPAAATGPTDDTGLPMRMWTDKTLYYSPTNLGLQAIRRLEGYRRTGDPAYLDSARRMADKIRELGIVEGDRIWLPFPYDDKRARMRAPWVNALGQAVALALFSRLHRLEGRPEDLAFANGLFQSFTQLRRGNGPWISEVDNDGYLWFEHYPDGLRGHVLNAHAYAVLALRDYWQETRSAEALKWLEGGLATLRDKGPEFRRPGTWSWYNLRNPAAHANYHLFHIREFRALAVAAGDPWFGQFADLLVEDFQWSEAPSWMHRPRKPSPGVVPEFTPGTSPAPGPDSGPAPSPAP